MTDTAMLHSIVDQIRTIVEDEDTNTVINDGWVKTGDHPVVKGRPVVDHVGDKARIEHAKDVLRDIQELIKKVDRAG